MWDCGFSGGNKESAFFAIFLSLTNTEGEYE